MIHILPTGLFICVIALSTAPAVAAVSKINNPMFQGDRLDWCRGWGVGCGKEAAEAFCKMQGFEKATAFQIDPDIGATTRTRVMGTGAVCDQAFCDGFKSITCESAAPATKTYPVPTMGPNRLDWCLNWAQGCGKAAADRFCQVNGYGKAVAFQQDPDIGAASPTRLISTGAVCDQAFCDGFKSITCAP